MRIYNDHSVSCKCPWCMAGWDSFGEMDVLFVDPDEMKRCWSDEEPDLINVELDGWLTAKGSKKR